MLLNTIIAVIKLTEAKFFNLSSTNLLTKVHWAKIQYYLGLSQEIVTLQLALSVGRTCALIKYNGLIWQDQVHIKQVRIRRNL